MRIQNMLSAPQLIFLGALLGASVCASPIEFVMDTSPNGSRSDPAVRSGKWPTTTRAPPNGTAGEAYQLQSPSLAADKGSSDNNSNNNNGSAVAMLLPQDGDGSRAVAPAASPQLPTFVAAMPSTKKPEKKIKCHCDTCKDANHICETDGFCFTSVEKNSDDTITFSYRCLNMSQSFPPGRFIWCNDGLHGGPTARPVGRRGAHACCDDGDFCNLFLKPKARDQPSNPLEGQRGSSVAVEGACDLHVLSS
ncbi:hypothetical protein M5D96_011486 [Drosophila gunungcola]|uniref:Activin types I and II receptor domain-containing protein n=1 Tax=Drosophila gunungcola TaxID=103775 RepID=A0A9Q0BKZ3_9MUSC|nr:hypothetical protein M5D96_011486 [Drosophila gunungcola]